MVQVEMVSFQRIPSAQEEQAEMAMETLMETPMEAMVALMTIMGVMPKRGNLTLMILHLILILKNLITKVLTHQHLVTIDVDHLLVLVNT